jgi:hypothetical protein
LPWDNPAHATSRLIHITLTTRNKVDVAVHNCLPRHLTAVHAEIEAFHCLVGDEDNEPNLIKQ